MTDLLGCRVCDRVDGLVVPIVEPGVAVCRDDGFDRHRRAFGRAPGCRLRLQHRNQRAELVQLDQLGLDLDFLDLAA